MNLNPLILPEIISSVLNYVDVKTLKASRLVSPCWNKEAGKILSSSCRVTNHEDLQETLLTSPDPSLFFRKLSLFYNHFLKEDIIFNLLRTHGTFLKTLELNNSYLFASQSPTGDEPAKCQLLIHRVLTEWCPFLQEFKLALLYPSIEEMCLIPSLELTGPTNLRNIKLEIECEIPEGLQDFLVQILAASPKIKVLRISRYSSGVKDRLYRNLTDLQRITKNLEKFTYKGDCNLDETNMFLTNQLKTLKIHYADVDPKWFHIMTNTIGSSLKNLELMDCGFNQGTSEEFQSHLFEIVIVRLVSLDTLRFGYRDCSPDHFFSNADRLNAPPHQNLRRLIFPWCCQSNVLEMSSVSNVVKWFPNLTLVSLCFGSDMEDEGTVGEGIRLQEAVGILSGLKRLKDLNLRLCSNTAPGDLQLAFKALKQIPSLLCCTFAEVNNPMFTNKTTYLLEELEDVWKEMKHLNVIRLLGFQISGNRYQSTLKFLKYHGIKLEIHEFTKGLSIDGQFWTSGFSY